MNIGSKVYRAHTVQNSMVWAREHILDAPDGAVFLADVLVSAQGRQGRVWQISPGQLLVTFILKPSQFGHIHADDFAIRLNQLTMAIALGILDPLCIYGVKLKWPNDFILHGKKLGGLLIHTVWHDQKPLGLVIGFGLNINNEFNENNELHSTAISLKMATQSPIEMRPLYKKIIEYLNVWYTWWQQEQFTHIYKTWKEAQAFLGQEVSIHQKDGALLRGIAQQVLPNGDLMMMTQDKKLQAVSFYQVEDVQLK